MLFWPLFWSFVQVVFFRGLPYSSYGFEQIKVLKCQKEEARRGPPYDIQSDQRN